MYNLTVVASLWVVTADPNIDLVTSISLKEPVLDIGPTFVVPKPTLFTLTNSSSIFKISELTIVPIPDKDIIEVDIDTWPLTLLTKLVVIGV